jgi:hypothetical protein
LRASSQRADHVAIACFTQAGIPGGFNHGNNPYPDVKSYDWNSSNGRANLGPESDYFCEQYLELVAAFMDITFN